MNDFKWDYDANYSTDDSGTDGERDYEFDSEDCSEDDAGAESEVWSTPEHSPVSPATRNANDTFKDATKHAKAFKSTKQNNNSQSKNKKMPDWPAEVDDSTLWVQPLSVTKDIRIEIGGT